jgi:hypothetical protein
VSFRRTCIEKTGSVVNVTSYCVVEGLLAGEVMFNGTSNRVFEASLNCSNKAQILKLLLRLVGKEFTSEIRTNLQPAELKTNLFISGVEGLTFDIMSS